MTERLLTTAGSSHTPLRFWLGCAVFAAGTLIGGGESLRWMARLG